MNRQELPTLSNPCVFLHTKKGLTARPESHFDTFTKLIVKSGKLKVFTLSCHLRPLVGDPANWSLLSLNRLDSRATHENDRKNFQLSIFNLKTGLFTSLRMTVKQAGF